MSGTVSWDVLILLVGVAVFVGGGVGSLAWFLASMKAQILEKIGDSRHKLRDELTSLISRTEEDFNTAITKLDANVASIGAKLDIHRNEDAQNFARVGERLAHLEAAE